MKYTMMMKSTRVYLSTLNGIATPYPRDMKSRVGVMVQFISITKQAFSVHVSKTTYSHLLNFSAPVPVNRRFTRKTQDNNKGRPKNLNCCFTK